MRDLFEENKAALISDIDKSTFIDDFGSVPLQYKEIHEEVADDDQNSKSKFEWMNMREHESLMNRRKGPHIAKAQADFLLKILNLFWTRKIDLPNVQSINVYLSKTEKSK